MLLLSILLSCVHTRINTLIFRYISEHNYNIISEYINMYQSIRLISTNFRLNYCDVCLYIIKSILKACRGCIYGSDLTIMHTNIYTIYYISMYSNHRQSCQCLYKLVFKPSRKLPRNFIGITAYTLSI